MATDSNGIFQDWVLNQSPSQQVSLASVVRGCDYAAQDDSVQNIIRHLRRAILRKAFRDDDVSLVGNHISLTVSMGQFLRDFHNHRVNFLLSLLAAAEVVGYKQSAPSVQRVWRQFYEEVVCAMGLNPETREQLDARTGESLDHERRCSKAAVDDTLEAPGHDLAETPERCHGSVGGGRVSDSSVHDLA